MSNRATALLAALLVLLITLPYLVAAGQGGDEQIFGGFLFNPLDGNSYLAKMQQGRAGAWTFTLPYTADPGPGVVLFIFYLALGQLSRVMAIPVVWMFHLARVLCAVVLVFALRSFFARIFPNLPRVRRWALLLAVFGSGTGWMVALLGGLPSDLWVAEGYPFLSAYANPHFPLGLALMAVLFTCLLTEDGYRLGHVLVVFALGLALAIVMPFALVVAGMVYGVYFCWQWLATRRARLLPFLAAFSGGGALLLWQYVVITSHPTLSVWNAQNTTPSPPLWDALLSFSPALLGSLLAVPVLMRREKTAALRLLLSWYFVGLVLIYLPFSLQRRFMVGYFIPCAGMATLTASLLLMRKPAFRILPAAILLLSLPTNLIILMSGFFGSMSLDPMLYISRDEAAAFIWIQDNTAPDALVLAGEKLGMFIPAHTGRRVLYGHPFETAHASQELAQVESFYRGEFGEDAATFFFTERGIDYVVEGPREQNVGRFSPVSPLKLAFESGPVRIYRVGGNP